MKFWNIGGEGQFIMGAVFASFVALVLPPESIPHWLLLLLMALAGIIGGGIWALVPAFFGCRFGTNETLLTLMLNYIALYIVHICATVPGATPRRAASQNREIPGACLARPDFSGWI